MELGAKINQLGVEGAGTETGHQRQHPNQVGEKRAGAEAGRQRKPARKRETGRRGRSQERRTYTRVNLLGEK
jgi:hypothetical protein